MEDHEAEEDPEHGLTKPALSDISRSSRMGEDSESRWTIKKQRGTMVCLTLTSTAPTVLHPSLNTDICTKNCNFG